jgi:esterase/lipase/1-acyl-sn-glycerol-3-phosphate acyltransferase
MDRPPRLTTFAHYPDPAPEEYPPAGFSTDLHASPDAGRTAAEEPTSRIGRATRGATRFSLALIEKLIHSTIRIEGAHNLGSGPLLFVANHFTRFETFVLPWIISNVNRGRTPHTLAFHELFRGGFGDFLMTMGARPTGDPVVKHTIVENLMTGRHDWLIYPEGSMIKNKKTWANGRFEIDSPDRSGPIHSGAAIMALKAVMYKRLYQEACRKGDRELMARYENRYHLSGPVDVAVPDVQVVPVNITYFPIRPGKNALYRMARWLFRQLPTILEEELVIEGSLLLSETDISVYLGKPIALDRYLDLVMPTLLAPMPFVEQLRKANHTLGALKDRLTRRMMQEVYSHLTVNFDHLFAGGLRALVGGPEPRERIRCDDFHQAIYLAARQIQADGRRRSHPSISAGLIDLLGGVPYKPLESIRELAKDDGLLAMVDGEYRIDAAAVGKQHSFHDIRLKNVTAVIANELEPLRKAVKILRNAVHLPPSTLHRQVAEQLRTEEQEAFLAERLALTAEPQLTAPDVGRPFVLQRPEDRVGIVLSHGYLSAPEEIRPLADHLHRLGFAVHGLRLPGHGTAPAALGRVACEDWVRAFERAYVAMRNTCRHVILGGFSAGALLALESASRHQVAGVFAINPCLRLMDRTSLLVPAVCCWNHALGALRLGRLGFHRFANRAEHPQVNYAQNSVSGVRQLQRLIVRCDSCLGKVAAPALVVQGDHDPVVDAATARQALERLGSEEKELAMMAFARHVIVRGEGSEAVLQRVGEFALGIAERLGCDTPRRERTTSRSRRPAAG